MNTAETSPGVENGSDWHPNAKDAMMDTAELAAADVPKFRAGTTLSEDPPVNPEAELADLRRRANENVELGEKMARAQAADERYIDEHGVDAFVARAKKDSISVNLYRVLELPPLGYKYKPRTPDEEKMLGYARGDLVRSTTKRVS